MRRDLREDLQVPRKRAPRACIQCRKRKIRCNVTNGYDNPCERCARRKLDCEYISVAEETERSPGGDTTPLPSTSSSTPHYPMDNPPTYAHRYLTYPADMAPIGPLEEHRIFPNIGRQEFPSDHTQGSWTTTPFTNQIYPADVPQQRQYDPWNNAYNTHYYHHPVQMHPDVVYAQ
ncbi:hypothetical protein FB45DRAFT_1096182 [Roridomyces roridus]|uniref:Zn(2)-C6 fungal-type domain-containing protein n=1 Tax=Roridomyces roridus TaxID=1738132 RepID=A0AAD7FEV5_9AGAR|nr:hypothetical protein FB45DRAFT_1096182 [Roridomyces roridus]